MLSIQWLAGSNSLADNQKMHDAIIGVCNIVNWTMPTFLAMTDVLAHRETRFRHYSVEDQSLVVAADIAVHLKKKKHVLVSWTRETNPTEHKTRHDPGSYSISRRRLQAPEEISEHRKMMHGRRRGDARREPDFHFTQITVFDGVAPYPNLARRFHGT